MKNPKVTYTDAIAKCGQCGSCNCFCRYIGSFWFMKPTGRILWERDVKGIVVFWGLGIWKFKKSFLWKIGWERQ